MKDLRDKFTHITHPGLYDRKGITKDVTIIPRDAEERALSDAVNSFISQRKTLNRYSRLKPDRFLSRYKYPAMFTPPDSGLGYLFSDDERWWNFVDDLAPALTAEVKDEEKELVSYLYVNYARLHPETVQIHENPNYAVNSRYYDKDAMEAALRVFTRFEEESFNNVDLSRLKQRAKKTTAMGFPYELLDGTPVKREDIIYGREVDEPWAKTRFRRDESRVKLDWLSNEAGCRRIFLDQCDQVSRGVDPTNVNQLMHDLIITTVNPARRTNCPDKITGNRLNSKEELWSRDRGYAVFLKDGIEIGTLDVRAWNKRAKSYDSLPGASNRGRTIYPSNNVSHYYPSLFAAACLHDVEKGASGHPSIRPNVVRRWQNFYKKYHKTHDIFVLSADCENAEVTVTTNFKMLLGLIPTAIRGYLDLTSCTVQPTTAGFRVIRNAYCSAVWYTTYMHVHKGNFEGARLSYHLAKRIQCDVPNEATFVESFITCLMAADDDFESGDVACAPFLGTDDILFPIGFKKDRYVGTPSFDDNMLKSTMMRAEVGTHPRIAFGMKATPDDLVESFSSRISKLFTTENMGFSLRDGMASYERIHNCGHTELIDFYLKKHFNVGHTSYYRCVQLFKEYLRDLGVNFADAINMYSPVERLLYGDLVSEDPISDTSSIPLAIVDRMYTDIKDFVRF